MDQAIKAVLNDVFPTFTDRDREQYYNWVIVPELDRRNVQLTPENVMQLLQSKGLVK